ncbi:MAG: CsgE family curli-type amyloid fiber assembly protein [Flavobacteriaceae bacterium]
MLFRNQLLRYVIFCVMICVHTESVGQYLNRDSKAILEIVANEGLFEITAKAENTSHIKQSLSYELKVFKENLVSGNKSESKQEGRFIIDPLNLKKLAFTALNVSDKDDRIVLLLLLRNTDDVIVGKSRKVIVNNQVEKNSQAITLVKKPEDGVEISGMVLEKIKTKPGRDFYNFFYSQFLSYNFKDTRSVLVEEVFSRGRNTKIEIKIDNVKIYEFFVQPKTDYLKANATVAISQVTNFFSKKKDNYIVRY